MPLYDASSSQYSSDAAALTFTPSDILPHSTGDLLVYGVVADGSPASALTASAGWTPQDSGASSDGLRIAFFYKTAASGSETAPTFTSPVSSNWGVELKVWEDAYVTPIDSFAFNNAIAASLTHTSPALTTINNACGLYYLFASDCAANPRAYLSPNELVPSQILAPSSTFVMMTGTRRQETAGAVPTVTALQDQSQGGQSLVIAIRSADGVNNMQAPPEGVNMVRFFSEHNGFNSYSAPNTLAASINGINCHTAAPTGSEATASGIKNWGRGTSFLGTTTLNANYWEGPVVTGLSANLSTGLLSINWQINSTATNRIGAEGAIIVLKSSAGNWRAYQLRRRAEMVANTAYSKVFEPSTATVYASAGTVNLASIAEVGVLLHRSSIANGTANSMLLANLVQLTTAKLIGGGLSNPLGFNLLANQLQYFYGGVGWATALGTFTELRQSIEIGNNLINTYLDHSSGGFQFAANGKSAFAEFEVGANSLSLTVETTATGELDLSSSIIKTAVQQNFVIDAGAANPSMVSSGLSLIGFAPTLKTGFNFTSTVFSQSGEVDLKAATYTSCTFSGGTNTGGAATKMDTGASLASCSFAKGSETYALRIPAAGTYSINGTTFSGYTTVINVTAASSTVTINLAAGQATPTYITSGATVVFVYPQLTASVLLNVSGAMVEVVNVTDSNTVIQRGIVAGTSWTLNYDEGADFTAGDVVRVRVVKVVGATAHEPEEYTAVAGTSGWSVNAILVTTKTQASAYNTWAIDGPAVTKFTQDNGNIDIDITSGTTGSKKELAAWWYGQLMTVAGIRDFWGAYTIEAVNSIRQNVGVADVLIQNTNVGTSFVFTDSDVRYYRSDLTNPWDVSAGYGSIFADYAGVPLVVSGGGGGATAAEVRIEMDANSTRLAAIDAKTTNLPSDPADQSLLISAIGTPMQASSYTAPDNASIAAIKAKTDNLPTDPADQSLLTASIAAIPAAPTVGDIADAVWDEVLTGATHNVPTSAGRRVRQLGTRLALEGSVIGTPTTTSVQTDATETTSGFYNDQTFRFTSGVLMGQAYPVAGYNGTTKTFTFDEAFTSAPSAADTFEVDSDHVHPISQIQAGLATSTEVGAIPTAEENADAVRTELATELARIDVATSEAATPAEVATAITAASLATHADANVINEGVQLASLFIPHSTDLP